MTGADFTIGRLSDETGVNIETIRYYERIGLMPQPPRSDGGRRIYSAAYSRRLAFIRRGRELGFSLDDIRSLMGLQDHAPTCAEAYGLAARHLDEIRSKIVDLKRMERALSKTASACERNVDAECPLIEALSGGQEDAA